MASIKDQLVTNDCLKSFYNNIQDNGLQLNNHLTIIGYGKGIQFKQQNNSSNFFTIENLNDGSTNSLSFVRRNNNGSIFNPMLSFASNGDVSLNKTKWLSALNLPEFIMSRVTGVIFDNIGTYAIPSSVLVNSHTVVSAYTNNGIIVTPFKDSSGQWKVRGTYPDGTPAVNQSNIVLYVAFLKT